MTRRVDLEIDLIWRRCADRMERADLSTLEGKRELVKAFEDARRDERWVTKWRARS